MIHFSRPVVLAAAALAIAGGSFALVYSLRGPDERSAAEGPLALPSDAPSPANGPNIEPPGPDVTPEPGATPNTEKPFWFVPYFNQDRQKPTFRGTLNGFTIDPESKGRSALDVCPGTGLDLPEPGTFVETVGRPGPLQIDPAKMPPGVEPADLPQVFLCHGDVAQVVWHFNVRPGTTGVNPGGGVVTIGRIRGLDPLIQTAPRDRWIAATVAGRPAVLSPPIVTANDKSVGGCFVAVYDPATDVLTTVLAGDSVEFCVAVAQAVVS